MAKPAEHAMETLLEEAKLSEEVWEVLLDAPREEREKPLPKKGSSGGVGEWLREMVGSRESKGVGGSTPRTGKAREGAKVEEEEDAQLAAAIQVHLEPSCFLLLTNPFNNSPHQFRIILP